MATVTQRPVREATQDHPPGLQRRQGSWRWRRSIVAAGVLTVAIVFLPTIAARTPLARWLVAKAAADLDGTASVASLRLGWLSAPVVDGIEIRDRQDRPLVQVKRVRTERSLLGLLLNPKRVGRIVVERPSSTWSTTAWRRIWKRSFRVDSRRGFERFKASTWNWRLPGQRWRHDRCAVERVVAGGLVRLEGGAAGQRGKPRDPQSARPDRRQRRVGGLTSRIVAPGGGER